MLTLLAADIDPINLVDKASVASDRWLFLACIVFIVIAFIAVIRYLVKDRDKERDARSKENEAHQKWVENTYGENVKLTAQVLVALQDNNTLLRKLEPLLTHLEKP